ncbi:MAG: helix-turn-helix transcriptional regulator [Acidimicrobiaceae bacterium]|nr:helix-turn-helix transcriptional regulator [Acidimicrobiaceae bacterium]
MPNKFKDLAAPLYEDPDSVKKISDYKRAVEAEIVAHQLGELRRELGVDQLELAERLGMTQGGISKLERSADPKLSTLRKLTEALGGTLRIEVEVEGRTYHLSDTPSDG